MVRLHLKKGNDSLFLHDTTVTQNVGELTNDVIAVYDLQLKCTRLCEGLEILRDIFVLESNSPYSVFDDHTFLFI